jgi:hypothetical protein
MSQAYPRRSVLQAGAAGLFLPSLVTESIGRSVQAIELPSGSSPLVMIQLSGGNDGLASIVPHGEDELFRLRKTTLNPKKQLLPIDDYRAFNPKLGAFRSEFDAGRLAIVEGCGYPVPIRSHFRSMEIWHTGDHRGRASGDGWIGKLAEQAWGDAGEPDSVVHFGGRAPYSVHSSTHPAVAVASPTAYRWFGEQDVYSMGGSAICENEPDPGSSGVKKPAPSGRHIGRFSFSARPWTTPPSLPAACGAPPLVTRRTSSIRVASSRPPCGTSPRSSVVALERACSPC